MKIKVITQSGSEYIIDRNKKIINSSQFSQIFGIEIGKNMMIYWPDGRSFNRTTPVVSIQTL